MIFKIYEYDNYDHDVTHPSTKADLRHYLIAKDLPELIQVGSCEVREHKGGHPFKEPVATIKNNLPLLVWETSPEQQKAYNEWLLEGKTHQWYGDTFSRTIEAPIWGYDVQTVKQVRQILDTFKMIIIHDDDIIICH